MVAKAEVQRLIENLFDEVDVKNDMYQLKGDDVNDRFTIQFIGGARLAERRIGKARMALKDSSGKHRELFLATPAGPRTRIFINPDKNPITIPLNL